MSPPRDERYVVADRLEGDALELERAAAHLRGAAEHFRGGDVPHGSAHVLAAVGHLSKVRRDLDDLAELHATRSTP